MRGNTWKHETMTPNNRTRTYLQEEAPAYPKVNEALGRTATKFDFRNEDPLLRSGRPNNLEASPIEQKIVERYNRQRKAPLIGN